MTNKENQTIAQLTSLVESLVKQNQEFRAQINERVEVAERKVEKKHTPINLESDILSAAQSAISAAISSTLTGYGSPLGKLVAGVVEEQNTYLREVIRDSFLEVIKRDDFKTSIVQSFSHKVARSIISGNDSLFDKVTNDMKQDPVFRSRMTLAVAAVVEECIKK